jgi:hypothetical protein
VTVRLGAASSIAGTIAAAATKQPVAGAQIAVSPYDANGDSGRAVSDGAGAFVVPGLAPGSYDVEISAGGYSSESRRGVTVSQGQRFPLRIELHQTGAVEGVVRDTASRPVAFALVRLSEWGAPAAEARADESGAYRLPGIAAGRSSFLALRDGAALGTIASAVVPEGGTARLDFQLADDGVVTGRVRRKDGSLPPAGASVVAFPTDAATRTADAGGIPVDASGAYQASLPAGAYRIGVQQPRAGFRDFRYVTVRPSQTVTQDLAYADAVEDANGFSVSVLEPDGTPSAGALVGASGSGYWINGQADEQGRFNLGRPRADLPDKLDLFALNGGRAARATAGPQQNEIALQLQPAATLRGRLTGSPPDGFGIELSPAGFHSGTRSLEFAGDRFELRDVPALPLHVAVTARDGRVGSLDLSLAPGEAREVEIALQPAPPPPPEPPDAGPPRAEPGTIGASLRGDSEMPPTVISLIPDGPAERAGVQLGDQISAVDGKPVTGVSDAVLRIRGAPGTPVQLALKRNGSPLGFTLLRAR